MLYYTLYPFISLQSLVTMRKLTMYTVKTALV